jgi:hypothetical protein
VAAATTAGALTVIAPLTALQRAAVGLQTPRAPTAAVAERQRRREYNQRRRAARITDLERCGGPLVPSMKQANGDQLELENNVL